jgi:hypothetical protein
VTAIAIPQRPAFWRMDEPELSSTGEVLRGGMWPHQREWWDMPNFIKALVTGYGGGKTMTLGKRAIYTAMLNAPVPTMTVSPTYPMAEATVVETINELLDGRCTLEKHLTFKLVKKTPYTFTIHNRSRTASIRCYSGEKPARLKGPNVGPCYIDEPFIQHQEVYKQVIGRVRHPLAKIKEIGLTGTPEGVVGWGFDLCEGEMGQKQGVGVVQASTTANRALTPDFVARMEAAYDDAALSAYRDGKFVNMATGRVYHSFDATIHVKDEPMPPQAELCVGMDFNVDPMAYLVFWRHGDRVHFIAEHEQFNSDAEQCAALIRSEYPTIRKVYPDASGSQRSHDGGGGKSAHAYLAAAGLRVIARPANPLRIDRINAVNGGLRNGRVTISPECRKLRSYLLANTHKDSGTKAQKAMGHLIDAFGYPIAYLFPVDRTATQLVTFRQ